MAGWTPLRGHSMAWSKAKENCELEWRNPTSTQEFAWLCRVIWTNTLPTQWTKVPLLERLICLAIIDPILRPSFSEPWWKTVFSVIVYTARFWLRFFFPSRTVWEKNTQQTCTFPNVDVDHSPSCVLLLFYSFSKKSLNPLVLDMHRCLELFPASECPIWGRHATVGQRCVNLAVPKHTQSRCQELDYLKQFSAQKQRWMLSWSLQPFPANALGYDRWQETGAAN